MAQAPSTESRDRVRGTVEEALEQDFMQSQLGHLAGDGSPDAAISELTASGNPTECAAAIRALYAAGADSVVLQPVHGTEAEQLLRVERDIVPLLRDLRPANRART